MDELARDEATEPEAERHPRADEHLALVEANRATIQQLAQYQVGMDLNQIRVNWLIKHLIGEGDERYEFEIGFELLMRDVLAEALQQVQVALDARAAQERMQQLVSGIPDVSVLNRSERRRLNRETAGA